MAQNINSLQLLRNTAIFADKEKALTGITGKSTNDGTVKLARYYADATSGSVKTIFGICYNPTESETDYSYTIYDSPQEVIEALGDRVSDNEKAIALLNSGATVSGSVAYSIEKAIEKLDVEAVGGSGKVITTVSEADGKIAATAIDLTAGNVAATPFTGDSGTVAVNGDTVAAQIDSLAKSIKATAADAKSYKIHKLTADEISGLTESANIKEAYQLFDEEDQVSGETIKIYKDSSLKSVALDGQTLNFTYILANGSESTVGVDVSTFLAESEFGDGLAVNNHIVSIKKDATSEGFLTVSADGIKLSGVQNAINTAVSGISGSTTSTGGSHVTATVKQENGKVTGVTIEESDIASANALSAETKARKDEDAKIVAGVGFATGDTYTISANTGDGISLTGASSVANALYTLDNAIAAAKKANTLVKADDTVVVEKNREGNTTVRVNIKSATTVSNFVGYTSDGSFVKSEMFAGIDAGTY